MANVAPSTAAEAVQDLETELQDRQETFIKKQRVYKTRIELLQGELQAKRTERTAWMANDANMQKLRALHSQIQANVETVQTRTAHLVKEQESDLLRAFRARLLDVQTELEKEKSKTDDGATAWIDRSRGLESEVEREKDRADRLDRVNQTQGRENQRLKQQFQTQEDDRSFLVRQLVMVKRENQLLRKTYAEKEAARQAAADAIPGLAGAASTSWDPASVPLGSLQEHASGANTPLIGGHHHKRVGSPSVGKGRLPPRQEADSRYQDMVKRLTKMLEMERVHRRQVQASLEEFRASLTPLEKSLRECITKIATQGQVPDQTADAGGVPDGISPDVGAAMAVLTTAGHQHSHRHVEELPVDKFNAAKREQVLELWLSLDDTVSALDRATARAPYRDSDIPLPALTRPLTVADVGAGNREKGRKRPVSTGPGRRNR